MAPESRVKNSSRGAADLRLFVAADIDGALRERVADLAANLKKGVQFTGAHPSWIGPDNWHFTLFFLGWTPPDKAEAVAAALRAIRFEGFGIETGGLGVFPNPQRPSVLWLGLKIGAEKMIALQAQVSRALQPLGYEPDHKAFHPHLTLARIKSSKGVKGLLDVMSRHQGAGRGACRVGHFTLYRSELKPAGAVYTPLASIAAQSAGQPVI